MPLSRITSANTIGLFGSTSGKTTLQANTIAGTTTLTLPAATDSLVGRATTETLTNKTLTTPVINQLSSAAATALTLQSAGTTAITVDTSQNVGIGVTPSATSSGKAVEIGTVGNTLWGIGAADLQISAGTYYNGANKYAVTGSAVSAYELVAGSHRWYYAASGTAGNTATFSESMRIDSSGNLFVNQTAMNGAEKVGISYSRSASWGMQIRQTTAGPGATTYIAFKYVNDQTGYIASSDGSTTQYGTSSDYRLKENIAPITGALAKVFELKPSNWIWKSNGFTGQGFIAHELQEVIPDAVMGIKDAVDADDNPVYQGVDTSFLVATLTAAIQELKAINDTQAETINALTARIDTQAADIAELKTKVA